MNKIERPLNYITALTYVYSNLEVFDTLFNYILYIYDNIYEQYNLTPEEYISMIWSYEFNKNKVK